MPLSSIMNEAIDHDIRLMDIVHVPSMIFAVESVSAVVRNFIWNYWKETLALFGLEQDTKLSVDQEIERIQVKALQSDFTDKEFLCRFLLPNGLGVFVCAGKSLDHCFEQAVQQYANILHPLGKPE
jgi:hypothetical protein